MANEAAVMLDRKLWLTADRDKLVEDGDPEARFLFGIAGRKYNGAECKRLKYKPKGKPVAEDEADEQKEAEAPANKEAKKPANKGAKKARKKARKKGSK